MPKANAISVNPPSHGSVRLAKLRKRDGLARSATAIAVFLFGWPGGYHVALERRASSLHQQTGYSISCRNAAAAANGPTTRLASVSAQRIVNGVPKGTGPITAALAA